MDIPEIVFGLKKEFWKITIDLVFPEKDFKRLCFHLYLLVELKRNFEAKRFFGKEFLHRQNKGKILLNLLGLEDKTVYKENF